MKNFMATVCTLLVIQLSFSAKAEAVNKFSMQAILDGREVLFDIKVDRVDKKPFEHEIDHPVKGSTKLRITFLNKDDTPFYPIKELAESSISTKSSHVSSSIYFPHISLHAMQSYQLYGRRGIHYCSIVLDLPMKENESTLIVDLESFWDRTNCVSSMHRDQRELRDIKHLFEQDGGQRSYGAEIPVSLHISYGARGPHRPRKFAAVKLLEMAGTVEDEKYFTIIKAKSLEQIRAADLSFLTVP